MSFIRGRSDSQPFGIDRGLPRTQQIERRETRSNRLASGTLACRRCDAPVSGHPYPISITDELVCPFCANRGPVRDFLSLATPTRPAHVVIRVGSPRVLSA